MANTKILIVLLGLSLFMGAIASTQQQIIAQPYSPKKCPANNGDTFCTLQIQPGCACYNDGSCKYLTNGNGCTICKGKNVASFNAGEECPQGGTTPTPTKPTPTPAFTADKCPANYGIQVACTYQITPGCAGFKNGTYKYLTGGNKCTYCNSNNNIVSFNENQQCPKVSTPTPTPTPTPAFTPSKCPANYGIQVACTYQITPGCAGFKNGTYKYLTGGNKCTYCNSNNNIVSFNENQKCPKVSTPTPTPAFTPSKCPANYGIQVACTYQITPGCAGFKNGTYKYLTGGNKCTYCNSQNSNVVSFNENQKCPQLSTPTPTPAFKPNKCPVKTGAQIACTYQITPGCAGYKDGSYKYLTNGNRCTHCNAKNSNIVSFNENQSCPKVSNNGGSNNGGGFQWSWGK